MPTCWNETAGIGDTGDPVNHVAYTTNGAVSGPCPTGYNKRIPQVQLFVRIPKYNGGTYQLADGSDLFHVDFMNGWADGKFEQILDECEPSGEVGYNPSCGCTEFLTENTAAAPAVCDSDVKEYILDEETEIVSILPRGTCAGTNLIEKSWEIDPPFAATCGNDNEDEDEDEDENEDEDEDEDDSCEDDKKFRYKGKKKFSCDWVGENTDKRCEKMAGDVMLWKLCPLSCGKCEGSEEEDEEDEEVEELSCEDDGDFRFKGSKKKDCDWVERKINRKGFGICKKKVNKDDERIKDFCMTTCEQC